MRRIVVFAAAFALLLTGCAADAVTAAQTQAAPAKIVAAYFAPEDGAALSDSDLAVHPEVLVVRGMSELKAANAPQVWIDAAYLDDADREWLLSQSGVPVVVAGYADGLYAFAERLAFPIEMPAGTYVDPYKKGYCVWLQTLDDKGEVVRQSMRGGDELTVQAILETCDELLAE